MRRGAPLINHVMAVVERVGDDPFLKAIAWLHDTIEKTDETEESLREKGVPDAVVAQVLILSRPDDMDYFDYIDRVAADPVATQVKIADLLANLSDNPPLDKMQKLAKALLMLTDQRTP
jgi:(p)ppGpp synthase/HD superfamily hydrolase